MIITIFHWLTNPIFIFTLLVGLAIVFAFYKRKRAARIFYAVSTFWMLLVGVSPLPQILTHNLESRCRPLIPEKDSIATVIHVLVLGAGHTNIPDVPASIQLSSVAISRLTEAIRLHRYYPKSMLVLSGYSSRKNGSQAEVLANAAIELGVDPLDTIQNRSPKNTEEEVQFYLRRYGNKQKIILVTSAIHMRRTLLICDTYGLNPIPAPTDFLLKHDDKVYIYDFFPSAQKIMMMERVLHEYAGIIKHKIFN